MTDKIKITTAAEAAEYELDNEVWDDPAFLCRDGGLTAYAAGLRLCAARALEEVGADATVEKYYAALDRIEEEFRNL